MSLINNLIDNTVENGKVVYSEEIEKGLHFVILMTYESFYNGKNTNHHQGSSHLTCEALMTTGSRYTYGNGVFYLNKAKEHQTEDTSGNFKPLREELKTKNGFKVWQKDYQYDEREKIEEGKKIKFKTRNVIWLVEVPKMDLLNFLTEKKI